MIEKAIRILDDNTKVLYGIFGMIIGSGYFPTLDLLNEFFLQGSDPCDQDCRMGKWHPFALTAAEYEVVKNWWIEKHGITVVTTLGCQCWNDWVQEILNP